MRGQSCLESARSCCYSLNISMWLSHDCAVPVKKAWEEQGRVEGGAAVETAVSLVADVFCMPAYVCPIGCCSALSTAAAVVKNYLFSLCSLSLHFSAASLPINNCLGIISVDHTCQLVRLQGHRFLQFIAAVFMSSQSITFCSIELRGVKVTSLSWLRSPFGPSLSISRIT